MCLWKYEPTIVFFMVYLKPVAIFTVLKNWLQSTSHIHILYVCVSRSGHEEVRFFMSPAFCSATGSGRRFVDSRNLKHSTVAVEMEGIFWKLLSRQDTDINAPVLSIERWDGPNGWIHRLERTTRITDTPKCVLTAVVPMAGRVVDHRKSLVSL